MDEKIQRNCILCKNDNYPVNVKDKKRNFRRRCKPFIFDDGLYYKKTEKTDSSKRLKVVNKGTTDDIIKSIHATDHGGHLGFRKTEASDQIQHYSSFSAL